MVRGSGLVFHNLANRQQVADREPVRHLVQGQGVSGCRRLGGLGDESLGFAPPDPVFIAVVAPLRKIVVADWDAAEFGADDLFHFRQGIKPDED